MRVTTPEFIKSYGTLADKALTEPVTITKNDRNRRAILPEELTEEDIAAIAASEMDPRHDHLNEEVRDWQP